MFVKFEKFRVEEEACLIDFLKEKCPGISTKKIKSYIKYKMVEVDGCVVTKATEKVSVGSEVTVYLTQRVIDSFDLDIIYEDEDLVVIDKPAGLLSIGNSKERTLTAFRMVSDYIKKNDKKAKLFVVHRLDQGTSGVLLFAKNEKIKERLQKSWNDIVLKREYIAVVEGRTKNSGVIETYLKMNHFQKVYSTKDVKNGWYAKTNYRLKKFKNSYSLLQVDIDTGRRNQIRVHMSEMGHPVTGDKKYGAKKNPINRLALHASKLHLVDPRTGKVLKLEVEAPEELTNLVK